jgi:hypothetical protein
MAQPGPANSRRSRRFHSRANIATQDRVEWIEAGEEVTYLTYRAFHAAAPMDADLHTNLRGRNKIAGAADVQSSNNSGFCPLCAAWPGPNDSSSRSLHRRYCTIRSNHTPIGRQCVCRIDGAVVSQPVSAQLNRQPTPESLYQANERLKSHFSAAMTRAKRHALASISLS